jgi:hypothetical protein
MRSRFPTTGSRRPRTVAVRLLVGLTSALLAAGCGGGDDAAAAPTTGAATGPTTTVPTPEAPLDPGSAATAGQRPPTRGPVGGRPAVGRRVPLDVVRGVLDGAPIFAGDFADPYVLADGGDLYAYATDTVDANVPVLRLDRGDLSSAEYLGDALPQLPTWTTKGFQWAPSVWARPDGRFVLYYATPVASPGYGAATRQCISRGVSGSPAGPFVDDSTGPMICPLDEGGAIDPSVFVDADGTPYLVWKNDGNCCDLPTRVYSQRLTDDGTAVAGDPVELVRNDQPWEGDVVEGPSMVRFQPPGGERRYVLFYSANDWDSADYAVGVAVCDSIAGPCTKPPGGPWLASTQDFSGPGGQEFFESGGNVWMVHHGFLPGQAGTPGGERRLYLDEIRFEGADPVPVRTGASEARGKLDRWAWIGVAVVAVGVTGAVVLVRRLRRRRPGSAA